MGRRAFLAGAVSVTAIALGMIAPPVTAIVDNSSEFAVIGPVRYSESAGVQDNVYGASFVVIGDAFAENVITADDTVILTLTGATSGTGRLWFSRTNREFPAGGGLADDTLSVSDPTTAPATVGSGNPFTIINGGVIDDTILQTFIAVDKPGTYAGDVYIYEGSEPTMSADTVVQHTKFSFSTAGKPGSITVADDSLDLIASSVDVQSTTVTVLDDSANPTQLSSTDQITISSSNTAIANPITTTLAATSFDDSLIEPLGTATMTVSGGASSGSTTITLTPTGTLPGSGVTAVTLGASSIPLSTTAPGSWGMTFPDEQRILDLDRTTDDTTYYIVNDLFISNVLLGAQEADPNTGVVAEVSTSNSDWRGLMVTGGGRSPVEQVDDSATNVPVVLATGSDGSVVAALSWSSVTEGGVLTLRTGTGSASKWIVIEIAEPEPDPSTSPSGRVLAKSGAEIDFAVTLQDDFNNSYPNFRVSAQARSSRGTPLGPFSSVARTDSSGRASVTVPPPDDTYAGTAIITFTVTLPNGLPYPALTPPLVRVVYSESGQPTALVVAQAQSTPSTITPITVQTVIPHILVPYTGRAATTDGTPGTWTLPTPANPDGSGSPAGTMVTFTPTSVPATQIQVSAPEGVLLTSRSSADVNDGEAQITIDSGAPVYAYATTVGTHAIDFTVGELTTEALVRVSMSPDVAYSVESLVDDTVLEPGSFSTMSVRVVDAFGNPVPNTTDDSGGLVATSTGQLLFAGFTTQAVLLTDDSGVATVAVIAGRSVGSASVQVAPPASTRTPAWQPGYRPPAGFAPPVPTVSIDFEIGTPPVPEPPSITITGERGEVRGQPGILVDGVTVGIADATIVRPWIRLPGQTAYAQGTAERTVSVFDVADEIGEFTWQRRTGKKIYVYFATEDGAVQSKRIIIPAR